MIAKVQSNYIVQFANRIKKNKPVISQNIIPLNFQCYYSQN